MKLSRAEQYKGLLLGTVVGDSLGLPAEGLSKRRIAKLYPKAWQQRFFFHTGWISDDSEHSLFIAQSLLAHPDDVNAFKRRFAWCLRGWLLGLPAGVGKASLLSCLKLWLGLSNTGVFSAGNGAAMRSAMIGALFYDETEKRRTYVKAATEISHSDPKALTGALALAEISAWAIRNPQAPRPEWRSFYELLQSCGIDKDWQALLTELKQAHIANLSVADFAAKVAAPQAVSGYVYHSVPVVLYAWYQHYGDFAAGLEAMMRCGGDTDTTAAMLGAISGAVVGECGIPAKWLADFKDYPRSRTVFTQVAEQLAQVAEDKQPRAPVSYGWWWLPLRNSLFMIWVLLHGLRRLLPPY